MLFLTDCDIVYSVFERLTDFQIAKKVSKIKKYFFDENNQKLFGRWKNIFRKIEIREQNFVFFWKFLRISKVGWWIICAAGSLPRRRAKRARNACIPPYGVPGRCSSGWHSPSVGTPRSGVMFEFRQPPIRRDPIFRSSISNGSELWKITHFSKILSFDPPPLLAKTTFFKRV